ncbi:hypothetical protein ANCCAN_28410 [Ancylostoma caninum]|uniref:Uncharacterized protein n=1 Tax=Ancylostoma caninum TaxID=29170 RepID=A0A368F4M8_ANCCA|nr:hypothetical protein ANCCAN_28410 [Ancylostoma caninum]
MRELKKADPNYQILFVVYLTLEEAALRYGIGSDEIVSEKKRVADTARPTNRKGRAKRPGTSDIGPESKNPRL